MATIAYPGLPVTLLLTFVDSSTGLPADPDSLVLDITYGQEVGFVPDAAGPFAYAGASGPVSGQIWRITTGQYAFSWSVPATQTAGVYVANWTASYGGDSFLGVENFPVIGGGPVIPVPAGDLGYWTGSLAYDGLVIPFGGIDGNGVAWLWQHLDGWDSPDVQGGGVVPKSGDHGAWPAPQYYAARNLTLTVTASAPTQALRDVARAQLQQAVPVSGLAVFTYGEPVPKQAMVRRSGRVTETCPTLADVTFVIGLVAPDPRKYSTQALAAGAIGTPSATLGFTSPFTSPFGSPAQPPAGAVAVTNAGTFETRPLITIQGPVTSPSLTNVTTGQTVSWTGLVLGASDTLIVDFGLPQALLGGTAYRAADLPSSWWTLPPGTSTIQFGGETGAGSSFAVSWRSAWI